MTADHPIITRDWQVRAAVEGRLSVLVAPIKDQSTVRDRDGAEIWTGFMGWQTVEWVLDNPGACAKPCLPPLIVGRRYWCREAWRTPTSFNGTAADMAAGAKEAGYPRPWAPIRYEADGARDNWELADYVPGRLRPASQMPRWASRITIVPAEVRVCRLHDLTRDEAVGTGVITDEWRAWREEAATIGLPPGSRIENEIDVFAKHWDTTDGFTAWNGPGAYERNPWCAVARAAVHLRNIDRMEATRG